MNRAGLMRTQLGVEERSTGQDSNGEESISWNNVATIWGNVEPLTGRELYLAQAVRAEDTHRITIRYFKGLEPQDRFTYLDPEGQTHYYNITDVTDVDFRHRLMQCMAVEGLATG